MIRYILCVTSQASATCFASSHDIYKNKSKETDFAAAVDSRASSRRWGRIRGIMAWVLCGRPCNWPASVWHVSRSTEMPRASASSERQQTTSILLGRPMEFNAQCSCRRWLLFQSSIKSVSGQQHVPLVFVTGVCHCTTVVIKI
jgi:hypothetical protein